MLLIIPSIAIIISVLAFFLAYDQTQPKIVIQFVYASVILAYFPIRSIMQGNKFIKEKEMHEFVLLNWLRKIQAS
jgi:hypothetical protein